MVSFSSEAFLIVLAAAMCSILCAFSIFVVLIFHCCKVSHDLTYITDAARGSFLRARNSIFGSRRPSQNSSFEDLHSDPRMLSHGMLLPSTSGQFLKPPTCIV